MHKLIVERFSSKCGECGYGGVDWSGKQKVIMTTESRECPRCGVVFTHKEYPYEQARLESINA